ncbi:MAG: hypothetical protein QM831_12825 [Kofleriaceae bacterium]
MTAALSACAHPRSAIVAGGGVMVLGIVAETANSHTYCSDPGGFGCVGSQVGDDIGNGLAHAAGTALIIGGLAIIVGGLIGLSNEHPAKQP